MNVKVDSNAPATASDIGKYAIAVLLVAAGIAAFYWFADWPSAVRGLLPFAGLVAAAAVFAFSAKGRATKDYLSEARFELRKVIWPTRQETIQTTLAVIVLVVIMAAFLALVDISFAYMVQWIMGRGA